MILPQIIHMANLKSSIRICEPRSPQTSAAAAK